MKKIGAKRGTHVPPFVLTSNLKGVISQLLLCLLSSLFKRYRVFHKKMIAFSLAHVVAIASELGAL